MLVSSSPVFTEIKISNIDSQTQIYRSTSKRKDDHLEDFECEKNVSTKIDSLHFYRSVYSALPALQDCIDMEYSKLDLKTLNGKCKFLPRKLEIGI